MAAVTQHINDFDDPLSDHGDIENPRRGLPDQQTILVAHHDPQTFNNYAALGPKRIRKHTVTSSRYRLVRRTSKGNIVLDGSPMGRESAGTGKISQRRRRAVRSPAVHFARSGALLVMRM
jgi:hypothetical protein